MILTSAATSARRRHRSQALCLPGFASRHFISFVGIPQCTPHVKYDFSHHAAATPASYCCHLILRIDVITSHRLLLITPKNRRRRRQLEKCCAHQALVAFTASSSVPTTLRRRHFSADFEIDAAVIACFASLLAPPITARARLLLSMPIADDRPMPCTRAQARALHAMHGRA